MDLLSMLSERRDPTFFQNNLLALMLNIISLKKGRFSSIEAKKKKIKEKGHKNSHPQAIQAIYQRDCYCFVCNVAMQQISY